MAGQRKARTDGARTEVFGLRLDPKLRYMAELAARGDRRSLANFIERAIEQALMQTRLPGSVESSSWEESGHLWHISEPRRFARLAAKHPDLLTYREQEMKRLLDEMSVTDPKSGETVNFKLAFGGSYDEALIEKCWIEISYTVDNYVEGRPKLEQAMQAAGAAVRIGRR